MNTTPEDIPSEAADYHAKHSAPGQRPRYTNTHRHPTGKILAITKINKYPSIYHQQYKIVHNDTTDLHQHSVNSEQRHKSQRSPLRLLSHLGHGVVQCVPTVTTIQDYSIPTHEKHQWLLLQFIVLLMMDAKGVRNM